MNPMTERTEAQKIAVVSCEKEKLIDFYNGEACDMYTDDNRWNKTFKKGGMLEWYNPLYSFDFETSMFGHGIKEDWAMLENLEYIKSKYHFI